MDAVFSFSSYSLYENSKFFSDMRTGASEREREKQRAQRRRVESIKQAKSNTQNMRRSDDDDDEDEKEDERIIIRRRFR